MAPQSCLVFFFSPFSLFLGFERVLKRLRPWKTPPRGVHFGAYKNSVNEVLVPGSTQQTRRYTYTAREGRPGSGVLGLG